MIKSDSCFRTFNVANKKNSPSKENSTYNISKISVERDEFFLYKLQWHQQLNDDYTIDGTEFAHYCHDRLEKNTETQKRIF